MFGKRQKNPLELELRRRKIVPKRALRQMIEVATINQRGLGFELMNWHPGEIDLRSLIEEAYLKTPFRALQDISHATLVEHMPYEIVSKFKLFPLGTDGETGFLASSDPANREGASQVEDLLGVKVHLVKADGNQIESAIQLWKDNFHTPDKPPIEEGEEPPLINLHAWHHLQRIGEAKCVLAPSFGSQYTLTLSGKLPEGEPRETVVSGNMGRSLLLWFRASADVFLEHGADSVSRSAIQFGESSESVFEFTLSKDLFLRDRISFRRVEERPLAEHI